MGRLAYVGRRLSAGTGRLLYGIGDVLDSPTGWGAFGRITGAAGGVLFVGALLVRAPGLVYVVPVVWIVAAWCVSDSSATPPPLPYDPDSDELAGEIGEVDRVEWGPEGVMCTIHPVRGEVNDA